MESFRGALGGKAATPVSTLPRAAEGFSSPNWLVTFGDLLTLLVCLFLCTMSASRQNVSEKKTQPSKNIEVISREGSKTGDALSAGTPLAQHRKGPSSHLMKSGRSFTLDGFGASGTTLTPSSEREIDLLVSSGGYPVSDVLIESCSSGDQGIAEGAEIERALAMRSRCIDTGIPARLLRIRNFGSSCGVIRAGVEGATARSVVARMTITFTSSETHNGAGS